MLRIFIFSLILLVTTVCQAQVIDPDSLGQGPFMSDYIGQGGGTNGACGAQNDLTFNGACMTFNGAQLTFSGTP